MISVSNTSEESHDLNSISKVMNLKYFILGTKHIGILIILLKKSFGKWSVVQGQNFPWLNMVR